MAGNVPVGHVIPEIPARHTDLRLFRRRGRLRPPSPSLPQFLCSSLRILLGHYVCTISQAYCILPSYISFDYALLIPYLLSLYLEYIQYAKSKSD